MFKHHLKAATNIVSNEFCLRNAFSPELIYDIDNSTTLGKFFADISTTEIERYENNKGSEETHEFEHPNVNGLFITTVSAA